MTISFLNVADAPSSAVARSSMEQACVDLGGQVEERNGAAVIVSFGNSPEEAAACRESVGLAETSAGRKLELLSAPGAETALAEVASRFGMTSESSGADRREDGWWCCYGPRRSLLVADPGTRSEGFGAVAEAVEAAPGVTAVDVSSALASVTLDGPLSREAISRFCALDLRETSSAPGDFHPGSLARVPGAVLHEGENRFRLILGWAYGEYVWNVVADAIDGLGGLMVGVDALSPIGVQERSATNA